MTTTPMARRSRRAGGWRDGDRGRRPGARSGARHLARAGLRRSRAPPAAARGHGTAAAPGRRRCRPGRARRPRQRRNPRGGGRGGGLLPAAGAVRARRRQLPRAGRGAGRAGRAHQAALPPAGALAAPGPARRRCLGKPVRRPRQPRLAGPAASGQARRVRPAARGAGLGNRNRLRRATDAGALAALRLGGSAGFRQQPSPPAGAGTRRPGPHLGAHAGPDVVRPHPAPAAPRRQDRRRGPAIGV